MNVEDSIALQWTLWDVLAQSSRRVVELFRAWDEDKSGKIDASEFWRGLRSLDNLDVTREECDHLFHSLDKDGSGEIEYGELGELLRRPGTAQTQRNIDRMASHQPDRSRMAKVTAKNLNRNYAAMRSSALPASVSLEPQADISIQEQLHALLKAHSVKLIDLFREWDVDGNGGVNKKELRDAIALLGYRAPKAEVDALFATLDRDGDGFVEFGELKRVLGSADKARESGRETAHHQAHHQAHQLVTQQQQQLQAHLGTRRTSAQLLGAFLARNNVKLVRMFHEWDDNRDGTLDKRELRRAVIALGWPAGLAGKEDMDEIFSMLDEDGDGHIEFAELKKGLNSLVKSHSPPSATIHPSITPYLGASSIGLGITSGSSPRSPSPEKPRRLKWRDGALREQPDRPWRCPIAAPAGGCEAALKAAKEAARAAAKEAARAVLERKVATAQAAADEQAARAMEREAGKEAIVEASARAKYHKKLAAAGAKQMAEATAREAARAVAAPQEAISAHDSAEEPSPSSRAPNAHHSAHHSAGTGAHHGARAGSPTAPLQETPRLHQALHSWAPWWARPSPDSRPDSARDSADPREFEAKATAALAQQVALWAEEEQFMAQRRALSKVR